MANFAGKEPPRANKLLNEQTTQKERLNKCISSPCPMSYTVSYVKMPVTDRLRKASRR
jgi:hypothetical protein